MALRFRPNPGPFQIEIIRSVRLGMEGTFQALNFNVDALRDAAFFAHVVDPFDSVVSTAAMAALEPVENLWIVPLPVSLAEDDLLEAAQRDSRYEVYESSSTAYAGPGLESTVHAAPNTRQEIVYTLPDNDGSYLAVMHPKVGIVYSRWDPALHIGGREYRIFSAFDGANYEYYLMEYYFDTISEGGAFGGHSLWRYVRLITEVTFDSTRVRFRVGDRFRLPTRMTITNLPVPYYGYPSHYII